MSLRVFLDRSMLEVFANSRQCVTQRIYPTLDESVGLAVLSQGGTAMVRTLDAWDMAPTNTG